MMQSERHSILFWGFSMILGVVIAISSFTYININNLMDSSKWVAHTYEVVGKLDDLQILLTEGESGVRSYVVTGQQVYLEPHRRVKRDVDAFLFKVRDLTLDNETQQKRVAIVEDVVHKKVAMMDGLVKKRDEKGMEAAVAAINEGVPHKTMEAASAAISAMKVEEQNLLQQRFFKAERLADQTRSLIPTLIFVEFAGLCGCYWWVTGIIPVTKK
jgi:methyl-accepting chemotaxis protein